jgi:hypothetical protein
LRDHALAFEALALRLWRVADLSHGCPELLLFVVAAFAVDGATAQAFAIELFSTTLAPDEGAGRGVAQASRQWRWSKPVLIAAWKAIVVGVLAAIGAEHRALEHRAGSADEACHDVVGASRGAAAIGQDGGGKLFGACLRDVLGHGVDPASMTNDEQAHRHAARALEDFLALRKRLGELGREERKLVHSLSHHLRHAVYRTGERVPWRDRVIPARDVTAL